MAGHIKKRTRSDGSASYQARIPSPANARKDIVKTFERKRDAERWLAAQASAIDRGNFLDPRTTAKPFAELVETWRETRARSLAPKTRERYDSVLRAYLMPEFGRTPVAKLTREVARRYFARLATEGVSPGTARKVQVVLSSILSEGVELGLVRENVAARMKLPSPPRHDMTILTAAEVRLLAGAMPREQDRLAVYVAAYTGLRAGELWALRRRDIDLDARRLTVARALKDAHGHLEFGDTKTDRSRRVVSLSLFLVNMLAAHFGKIPADPDALVFTSPGGANGRRDGDGGPVRHGLFVRRYFKPAVERALPPNKRALRFHDLRHTCASLLIHDGASILLVQARLGHSSATTTMDRYGHLYPSAEAALADALDATYNAGNVIPLDPPVAEAEAV